MVLNNQNGFEAVGLLDFQSHIKLSLIKIMSIMMINIKIKYLNYLTTTKEVILHRI